MATARHGESRRIGATRATGRALAAVWSLLWLGSCGGDAPLHRMGTYELDDGRLVSIRRSAGDALRARIYQDGESRRLYPAGEGRYTSGPGFSGASPVELTVEFEVREAEEDVGRLTWAMSGAAPLQGTRVPIESEWLTFESGGATLRARLDLPSGPGPHPALVQIHGSGEDAGTEFLYMGDFFAANGIAVLTYDKRGTGGSEGDFTFSFEQLAKDAVAAVERLKAHPRIDSSRIGLSGYSQGGWVAPLAASMSPDIRFVLVHFGMIASPVEEARVETRNLLRNRGVADASLEEADELILAAVNVVANQFEDGWRELDEAKRNYADADWLPALAGTTVERMRTYPRWLVKRIGPFLTLEGLPWRYDSTPVLESLTISMVWLLGEADESAPIELAVPQLRALQAAGKPYELVLFPGADHSILEFTEVDGARVYTRYAPDYHRIAVESALRLSASPTP